MKKLFIILAQSFLIVSLCFGQKQNKSCYWINKDIDWQHPTTGDPEIDSIVEAATVNAIIFHPNGQFRMKSSNGGLANDTIYLHMDTFKVYRGIWKNTSLGEVELCYYFDKSVSIINPKWKMDTTLKTTRIDLNKKEFEFEGVHYLKGNKLSHRDRHQLEELVSRVKGKKE
jgi:hypothetical protein